MSQSGGRTGDGLRTPPAGPKNDSLIMSLISLKGITWGHSRGYTPLKALAQRFSELHPGVEIEWQKRSLQAFADQPLDDLCPHFDLLVIDHPWVGTVARFGYTLPLDQHLSSYFLEDQRMHSNGGVAWELSLCRTSVGPGH